MKDKILMVVFVLVLGSILTGVLVAVNFYTAPVIERNEEIRQKSSVLQAFAIPYTPGRVEEVFARNVEVQRQNGKTYYVGRDGDIAFPYTGSGLWGPIEGIVAIKPDFQTLTGVTVIQQEETPGLGGRIAGQPFLSEFEGKRFVPKLELVPAGRSRADNQIDSITGATLTSNAFIAILNENLGEYVPVIERGERK